MATYTVRVPEFVPTYLNQLLRAHWGKASAMKKKDREMIGTYVKMACVPQATGKRRVDLEIVLEKSQRAADGDAYWKSTLDALVACGALVDDNRQHCEISQPTFRRGDRRETIITLTDIPEDAA